MKAFGARINFWIALVVVVVLAGVAVNASETKVLKATRISTRAIAISCMNGGDPTGKMEGDVLIISCGK